MKNWRTVILNTGINTFKYIFCFLNLNHRQHIHSFEEGEGSYYKMVKSCSCGKRESKTDWVNDNILLEHGNKDLYL